MTENRRLGGIELGGTKSIALVANGRRIVARHTVPTTTPEETLAALRKQLLAWHADAPLDAIGIASFGPLRLDPSCADFGHMLVTPKPGWSGVDIASGITAPFTCPWRIDTDVNGAALAEWLWGARHARQNICYITLGTGVGGGFVVDGKPIHGFMHPEIGHIRMPRAMADTFPGICPFHGDCIEGLVSGPAIEARFGCPGPEIPADDARWMHVAHDLAQMCAIIMLTMSPHRILIGGGVGLSRTQLLPLIHTQFAVILAGYIPDLSGERVRDVITTPVLGADAGPLGAIALAMGL